MNTVLLKKSDINNAGNGLFTNTTFVKGEKITAYGGTVCKIDEYVENSDYTGISILGENESNIHFGDNEDPDVGRIEYSHSSNHMVFRTNAVSDCFT